MFCFRDQHSQDDSQPLILNQEMEQAALDQYDNKHQLHQQLGLSQPQQRQQQQQSQQQQPNNNEQSSNDNTNTNNNNNKPKRNPFCSRCRNHGKRAQVKGHKRYCEYRECQCMGCKLVQDRQAVSAKQIKLRRYQKQDEECGRRIEITPPVLSSSDSAALIAKSIIGSAKNIHHQQQQQVQAAAVVANHHHQQQLSTHLSSIHTANLAAAVAAAASSSSVTPTGANLHNHHHHHHQQQQQQTQHHHRNHQHSNGATSAISQQQPNEPHHHLNNLQQQQSSAFNNALHLFHYPSSVLSAAVANISPSPVTITGSTSMASNASSTLPNTDTNPSPMPNIREQIHLVEELYEDFGPLAIYAWLRAEQFDHQKVRDLIESSKDFFEELLQITGNSPVDLTSPIVD